MNDIEQLDLFGDLEPSSTVKKKKSSTLPKAATISTENDFPAEKKLSYPYNELIIDFLKNGLSSARDICNLLIEKHNARNTTFDITGKPHIYPEICMNLEKLVQEGVCTLVEKKNDYSDRIYKYISETK